MSPFNFALATGFPNPNGISALTKRRNNFFFRRFIFVNRRFVASL